MKAILIFIFMLFFSSNLFAGEIKYTVEGYAFCRTERILDQVINFSITKKRKALKKILDMRQAITLKPGTKVEILKTDSWQGRIKIMICETGLCLWTLTEAVE